MMDQPAGLMRKYTLALNVWNVFKRWSQARNKAQWGRANPDLYNVVAAVMELRDLKTRQQELIDG